MASNSTQAVASGDLVDLVSSSGAATIYPSDDAVLAVLQARFRADLPYTRIGATNYIAVNPYKTLASVNDVSAKEYEERCYKDTNLPMVDSPKPLQPHIYELAARMYLLMRRRNEPQALLSRGITGSGKTSNLHLFIGQILRLSTHSHKEAKVAEQIRAISTVLDSFGNAKTMMSPNASRHHRYLELHFNDRGRIASAKVLTFGLDKSRLNKLGQEERSFHVFYQFLAGSTTAERDALNLEDPSDYALLASSGTYRLPFGPFSDDAIAMGDLRVAMKTLGFKPKSSSAIFSLLFGILLLGNLEFAEGDHHDASAYVSNTHVLEQVARLLGVSSEGLNLALTNKTSYVRKELYTVLLNGHQSGLQRDQLMRDLYAIMFSFVVETINHKVAPSSKDPPPHSQIMILDQPGFQTKGPAGTTSMSLSGAAPLISAYGQNGFDEFCINFSDELVHSYILRRTFEDNIGYNSHVNGDGIALPPISTMDNTACVELLRGSHIFDKAQRKPGGILGVIDKACSSYKSGKDGEARNDELVQELAGKFGVHASFIGPTGDDRRQFGINHYAGACLYDAADFVERDADILDSSFVNLFRGSTDPLLLKLFKGPGLAAERHSKDEHIIVQAQVSSRPLRTVTPPTASTSTDLSVLDPSKVYPVTTQINVSMSEILANIDMSRFWTLSCIRPNDSGSSNSFDKRRVRAQIRSLLLPDITSRRSIEYVADLEVAEFCERYVPTMRGSETERITQCARANGWVEGIDYAVGHRMIWLSYNAWKTVEDTLRATEKDARKALRDGGMVDDDEDMSVLQDDTTEYTHGDHSGQASGNGYYNESEDNLLLSRTGADGTQYRDPNASQSYGAGGLQTPSQVNFGEQEDGSWSEWDKKGSPLLEGTQFPEGSASKEADGMVVKDIGNAVEEVPSSRTRRWWLWIVWATTWWIPSYLLRTVGRMKRPDVQLAWREKYTIFWLIFLFNGLVIFYIVIFGRLLCPDLDKAWNLTEVAEHTGDDDFYVAIQGSVYDVSNFVQGDHSDITGTASNSEANLEVLAGQDLTYYFPVPLVLGCQDLVTDDTLTLTIKNFTESVPTAMHTSGNLQSSTSSALHDDDWYTATFLPKIKKYYKGPVVYTPSALETEAEDTDIAKKWAIWNGDIYDLTDYFNTITTFSTDTSYVFLNSDVSDLFQERSGQDITSDLNSVMASLDSTTQAQNINCLKNTFYVGKTDFRKTARCTVQNYLLIVASGVLMASMALKFLAALQLGGKKNPELQDKFVICQVPCYTEGEDSLRKTVDSLAALNYDDKRKLIFIICDGNIIGSGNDRTTPRIVLDILGVDPKLDPEPLLFKSVGEGSRALNYGKVYSGLYEFEGHVVPYMVVVKVGKPTERSKPGNRGKRDSQILVLHYLNRVHFDAAMSPLELEIYHQMRNVIGIDPAFYEYIFTVDADTMVTPDSLNRLVAFSSDDSAIIGICGETKLANEEMSWWTMIQVYEYYISHHLSKAFESLFGSVTCLPGCFSLYRIRTADKGRPIIISNRVIDEYSEPNVDTLHKKNLFSLGEDRFLTTLMLKHFPTFKTKFCPDAIARTVAPDSWRVLFSQRRRWINSTVHNLCELVFLPELFGFCCFSMRFFVFIDLLGTLILPATVVYLTYLIIVVATKAAAVPTIALIMIAVVYGLQAIIFLIKREFMLIGWMVVYILSYPVYSFFLPVYSFWCMDEFGWGNTRLVIGEGKDKKVIVNDDDKFDESMIPLKKFSEYESEAWETSSRRTYDTGVESKPRSYSRPPGSREESPHTYHEASQTGDYYRDTNLTYNNNSNPNLRLGSNASISNLSHRGPPQHVMSPFANPAQMYGMPFSGSQAGSIAGGSDYGGHTMPPMLPPMGYQHSGSMYGNMMPQMDLRTTMMPNYNMMTGGSFGGSQSGAMVPPPPIGSNNAARMSTFSMATTVNAFSGPSMNPNPTDDDLFTALRNYLSTQDLMTVTKKSAREAIAARFPKADLTPRKDFLNHSIDTILSES